ncbi:MAG: hypothetical protein ACOYLO_14790, partial [Ferruginibacter sp.]
MKSGDLLLRKSDESLLRKFDDAKLLVTASVFLPLQLEGVGGRPDKTNYNNEQSIRQRTKGRTIYDATKAGSQSRGS